MSHGCTDWRRLGLQASALADLLPHLASIIGSASCVLCWCVICERLTSGCYLLVCPPYYAPLNIFQCVLCWYPFGMVANRSGELLVGQSKHFRFHLRAHTHRSFVFVFPDAMLTRQTLSCLDRSVLLQRLVLVISEVLEVIFTSAAKYRAGFAVREPSPREAKEVRRSC